MGFWNKVLRKQEKVEELKAEVTDMTLDQVNSLIKNKIDEMSSPILLKGGELLNEINLGLKNLDNNVKILENSSPRYEKIDPQLWSLVSGNRLGLVMKMRNFISSFDFPESISLSSLSDYYSSSVKFLVETSNNSVKNFEYVKTIFEDEVFKILHDFKSVDRLLGKLKKLIENEKILELQQYVSKIGKIKSNVNNISLKKIQIRHVEQVTRDSEKTIEDLRLKLKEIKDSEHLKNFEIAIKEKAKFKDELDRIGSQILFKISPLEKSLKKYRRILSEGKEKLKFENELSDYIDDPKEAFLRDDGFKILQQIIERIEFLINKGSLDLEEKKKIRTLESIKELKNISSLFEMRKNFLDLESKVRKVEEGIKEFESIDQRKFLEKKINSEMESLENKIKERKTLESEISLIAETTNQMKKELEFDLEKVAGRKINLLWIS